MDLSYRPIAEQDYRTICKFISSEEELFWAYDKGKYPLTVAQVKSLVERRIEPTVMLLRGRVVGFGDFYNHQTGKSIFIGNIIIDPAMRGRGLGKRLVCHLIERAFGEYDLPRVKMHVYSCNVPALVLYSALGFQPYCMKVKQDYKGAPTLVLGLRLNRDLS